MENPPNPLNHDSPGAFLKNSSLRASVNDAKSFAVMIGAGETYLTPFGIFLRASSLQIGILTSVPLLVGALCQSLGVWAMEHIASRRRLISLVVALQALIWLPLALLPWFPGTTFDKVNILILLVILYNIGGQTIVPVWNSLIGELVPIERRGAFFGFRNRQTGVFTFVALILAGEVLHLCESINLENIGYLSIFLIALVARLFSAYWLSRYDDPPYQFDRTNRFSFWQFLWRSPRSNFAKYVFFVAAMNFSTFIAAPYFAFYMLHDLKMDYFSYTFVVALATMSQFITMYYWGRLSDQFGNRKIMTVCGIGAGIVPFFWLIWSGTFAISLIQMWAGFMWAGFNLAAANFMFDAVTPPKRARCVAYQSIINSSFVVAGSLLGAYLSQNIPTDWPLHAGIWTPESKFLRIFFLSGVFRLLSVLVFLKLFIEVRPVQAIRHRDLVFRVVTLRPLSGATFSLVTGFLKKRKKEPPPRSSE